MHKAVHYARMGQHRNSRSHGVRLPNPIWEAVEELAANLGKSRNEVMATIVSRSPLVARENRKTVKSDRYSDEALASAFTED